MVRMGKNAGVQTISPSDVLQKIKPDGEAILVDVRTVGEYAEGHIPGAVLLPVDAISEEAEKKFPDKNGELIVYCRSGVRAGNAARALARMGYTNVRNLGGIINWPYETVRN